MAKWSVTARVVGSKYLGTFEADSKEEAEEKALKENGFVSLCRQCSGECEDPEVDSAEAYLEE